MRAGPWSPVWLLVGFVMVVVLVVGCGEATDRGEGPPANPSGDPTDRPSQSPSQSPSGSPAAGPVAAAVADLAGRLGIESSDVEVVAVEEVTWSDGSLGCAEPGMAYTQALVPGSRITLRAGGDEHEYHQGATGRPIRCARPTQ